MSKKHLKRINMPWFWQVDRKNRKFITRPCPGPHKLSSCITVDLLLRHFLRVAKVNKEIRYMLNNNKILIDKKAVKDNHFPVGLMDIIDVVDTGEHYRIFLDNNGKFELVKINKEQANYKLCKIINKTSLKGGKIQLNLVDGNNLIVDKDGYKIGDTIALDLNSKKIKKHIKFEEGSSVILTAGKHIGEIGKITKINVYGGMRKTTVNFENENMSFETLKEYCYVIDSDVGTKK